MKAQFLKISGHKNEKDFYKEFPTMESFMAKHGAALKKAQGGNMFSQDTNSNGVPDYLENAQQPQPINSNVNRFAKPALPQDSVTDPSALSGIQPYQKTQADIINERSQVVGAAPIATPSKLDPGKGPSFQTGVGIVDKIISGFSALKQEKKALKHARIWQGVSNVQRQAAQSTDVNKKSDIADTAARTRKAMMPTVSGDQLFPVYGVGTNVLAQSGKTTKKKDVRKAGDELVLPPIKELRQTMKRYIPASTDTNNAKRTAAISKISDANVKAGTEDFVSWYSHPETLKRFQKNTGFDSSRVKDLVDYGVNTPTIAKSQSYPFLGSDSQAEFQGYNNVPNEQIIYEPGVARGVVGHERAHASGMDTVLGPAIRRVLGDPFKQTSKNAPRDVKRYMNTPEESYGNFHQFRTKLGLKPGEQIKDVKELQKRTKAVGAEVENFYQTYDDDKILKAINTIANNNSPMPTYAAHGGEIMNTYAPNTLYDDLGYEPLYESVYQPLQNEDNVKAYKYGGKVTAQGGFSFGNFMNAMGGSSGGSGGGSGMANGIMGMIGSMGGSGGGKGFMSSMGGSGSMSGGIYGAAADMAGSFIKTNGGSQIGEGVGEAVGSFFGPIGQAVGKFAGKAIGSWADKRPGRIAAAQAQTNANNTAIAGVNFANNIHAGSAFTKHGGTMNPQVIKYFGNHNVNTLFREDPSMDTLRTGGNIRQNSVGDIKVLGGGHLEPVGYNPYSDGTGVTSMIQGRSHEDGGVFMNYNKADNGGSLEADVEAEGGEPVTEIGDNAVIFGDQVINERTVGSDPMFKDLRGKTFKKAMAGIAEQNQKLNKQQAKNTKALNSLDVRTPIDKLTLNSLSLNAKGIDTRYAINDAAMKKAAAYQEIVNEEAQRLGINSGDYSRGKLSTRELRTSRNGGTLIAQDGDSKYGLVPWQGNVMPDNKYGKKTASSFTVKDWDDIAENLGFTGKGNKQFQEFLMNNPEAKPMIEKRHKELYGTSPFIDEKLGYGWAPGELKGLKRPALATPGIVPDANMTPKENVTGKPAVTTNKENYDVTPYGKDYGLMDIARDILPWIRKQPGEPLQGDQIAGEMFALSNNQEEPVQARFYHPNLRSPYDISYQDQLNENQADFNQLVRASSNNPEALAALAAQKYSANSKVLGEQFRANQAMKEGVYNQNTQTLNDALLKNLNIADQQYVRQATAKSATKAVKQEALNSISAKIGQNRLENRTLQTYANMFPDFSYDRDMRIRKTGAPVKFNIPVIYGPTGEVTHKAVYDSEGNIVDYKPVEPAKTEEKKKERNGGIVKAFKDL